MKKTSIILREDNAVHALYDCALKLRVENENLRNDLILDRASSKGLRQCVGRLEAENKKLKEALKKYGKHEIGCGYCMMKEGWAGYGCTCGLQALNQSNNESNDSSNSGGESS